MSITGDDNGPDYDYRDFCVNGFDVGSACIMLVLFGVMALVLVLL